MVKSQLSGMPECKFGMNDKLFMQNEPKKPGDSNIDKGITIDDIKFHSSRVMGSSSIFYNKINQIDDIQNYRKY